MACKRSPVRPMGLVAAAAAKLAPETWSVRAWLKVAEASSRWPN